MMSHHVKLVCLHVMLLGSGGFSVSGQPVIVAHRGASVDAPENTMAAFNLAWEQGADAIEADFCITADNHIVCIHDKDTKRVSTTNLVVDQSTLKQLSELDVGIWSGEAFAGERIPTLRSVLGSLPKGKRIYLEVKFGAAGVPSLLKQIEASGLAADQVVIISFHPEVVAASKAGAPHLAAHWLCSFGKKRGSQAITPEVASVLETLKRTGADGIMSNVLIPDETRLEVMRQGYSWHAWTLNDPVQARMATENGASSIITDRPAFIRDALEQEVALENDADQ